MSTRLEGTEPTDSVIRPKVLLETGQIIPGYHDDREGTESFLQLDAAWGVASATTVFASWPVLTHKYYVIGHGGVQTTYNVRGVGDPVVGARQAFFRGPGRASAFSCPSARTTGSTSSTRRSSTRRCSPERGRAT